jgi:ribulose-5-phosphate 4-epimerase/fuculose-1-phosphate aldolase
VSQHEERMMDTLAAGRNAMSEAEWQARVDLAALYRICDLYGWTDTINTHLTARIPGEPDCFLINNYGDLFNEITASSLVKLGLDGKVYATSGAFNAAGFIIHSGVYKARPDVNCVMHTHTRAGTGISVLKQGLRPISQDVLAVYDELAYHEYGTPATQEECDALGVTCKHGDAVVLRNHGLLTLGATIPGTLRRMYMLERACEVEIIARGLGEEPSPIEPEVIEAYAARARQQRASPEFGMADWRAAVRQIEGKGTDWRQ